MISYMRMMKKLSLSAFAAICMGGTICITSAAAQTQDAMPDRQFSVATGEAVNNTLILINTNKHQEALVKLTALTDGVALTPYERSTIFQMQGASYYELSQYQNAIDAFENAVRAGGLLPDEATTLKLNIALLNIANSQYAKGAAALEDYFIRGGELKPQFIEILVQAWVQADDYSKALPWAEKWFESAAPKERKHYDLMNFLYSQLGMDSYQVDIINQMILRWPEDENLRKALSVVQAR